MRRVLLAAVLGMSTLVFGTAAILGCLLLPNGNALVWCARPWARSLLLASGVSVRVAGREKVPRGRAVLYLTNHLSHFDVLALVRALPGQYRMVAKKELFAIPVFGWAIWLAGFIRIDRSDRQKAFESLDRAALKLRRGTSVLVFAEGTRSPDGTLQPLKKGAFVLALRSGCPIVPVSISGSRWVLPRGTLRARRGAIDVVIGDPIDASLYGDETRDQLMARVRDAIRAGFTDLKALDVGGETGTAAGRGRG